VKRVEQRTRGEVERSKRRSLAGKRGMEVVQFRVWVPGSRFPSQFTVSPGEPA
jgi:hypothetical protein